MRSIPTVAVCSQRTELVVAITPFVSEELKRIAHVLLPIGTFAETSGTYVNCEGRWQSFRAGWRRRSARRAPAWKVLRVLGTLLGLAGFEYQSSEDVREELRALCADVTAHAYQGTHAVTPAGAASAAVASGEVRVVDLPMYQIDALVRRAPSLQKTREGRAAAATY